MASTDSLPLQTLAEDAAADCMALSAEAGWNQNADDWRLFMRHGIVFGLPGQGGRPAASGAILPYPEEFAWISMVLVTASRRRERIGTRILEICCAENERRGLVSVLDATPAGERVYRPLGFEPMFGLSRWQGEGGGTAPSSGVRTMSARDVPAIVEIDAEVFGADRAFLLESLFTRAPQLAFITNDASGFVLGRPGRIATQVGPIVAGDEDTAVSLLAAALASARGPVFLDVADRAVGLKRELERRDFTVQRPYLRMGLRRGAPFGDPARLFVIAGPEFG